jgi:hypothetical protein
MTFDRIWINNWNKFWEFLLQFVLGAFPLVMTYLLACWSFELRTSWRDMSVKTFGKMYVARVTAGLFVFTTRDDQKLSALFSVSDIPYWVPTYAGLNCRICSRPGDLAPGFVPTSYLILCGHRQNVRSWRFVTDGMAYVLWMVIT